MALGLLATGAAAVAAPALDEAQTWQRAARTFNYRPVYRPAETLGLDLRQMKTLRYGSGPAKGRCDALEARYAEFGLTPSLAEPDAGRYVRLVEGRVSPCGDLGESPLVTRPFVDGQRGYLIRYGEGPDRSMGSRSSGSAALWNSC